MSPKGLSGEAGTDVEYAKCVEYGVRPHEIKMRSGRKIHHPGFQGKYFLRRAAIAARKAL